MRIHAAASSLGGSARGWERKHGDPIGADQDRCESIASLHLPRERESGLSRFCGRRIADRPGGSPSSLARPSLKPILNRRTLFTSTLRAKKRDLVYNNTFTTLISSFHALILTNLRTTGVYNSQPFFPIFSSLFFPHFLSVISLKFLAIKTGNIVSYSNSQIAFDACRGTRIVGSVGSGEPPKFEIEINARREGSSVRGL